MSLVKLNAAARQIGIRPYLLRQLTRKNQVPFVFIGGAYWYDLDLLVNHFRTQMVSNINTQTVNQNATKMDCTTAHVH